MKSELFYLRSFAFIGGSQNELFLVVPVVSSWFNPFS